MKFRILLTLFLGACGAAPGYESETPRSGSELQPFSVGRPEVSIATMDQTHATVEVHVLLTNPNDAEAIVRRVDGDLLLDGVQVARIAVEGGESFAADSEREFVFHVRVPLTVLLAQHAERYVARGTLRADGGSGDGSLETPFEFEGPMPATH